MSFAQLPVEIVSAILAQTLRLEHPYSFLRLREVNKIFDVEVMRRFARYILLGGKHRKRRKIPTFFTALVIREMIRMRGVRKSHFLDHTVAVAEYLHKTSKSLLTTDTRDNESQQAYWIKEACSGMATSQNFYRTFPWQPYNEASVEVSAFIVAILGSRMDIIDSMLQSELTFGSYCPYLQTTAITAACETHALDIIKRIMESKQEEYPALCTALENAARKGQLDILAIMCDPVYNIHFPKPTIQRAVEKIIASRFWECLNLIIKTQRHAITDAEVYKYHVTQFQQMLSEGDQAKMVEVLQETARQGFRLKPRDFLFKAVCHGNSEIVSLLLNQEGEKGEEYTRDIRDNIQNSTLWQRQWSQMLVQGNSIDTFRVLDKLNINVGHKAQMFIMAIAQNSPAVAEHIAKPDLGQLYYDMITFRYAAYIVAVESKNWDMIPFLARIFTPYQRSHRRLNTAGATPLAAVVDMGSVDGARCLINMGAIPKDLERFKAKFSQQRRRARIAMFGQLVETLGLRIYQRWGGTYRIRWPTTQEMHGIVESVVGLLETREMTQESEVGGEVINLTD